MKKGCLIAVVVFFVLCLIAVFAGSDDKTETVATSADSATAEESKVEDKSKEDDGKWEYSMSKDEMNDEEKKIASITSDNSVDFDFPYNGGSTLKINVRKSPQYGLDVYIKISQGQFMANTYSGTNKVSVRFDEEKAIAFTTNEAADASTDILFLNNPNLFITNAKKAHTIKIQAPFFQEGNRVFTFTTTTPLKWD